MVKPSDARFLSIRVVVQPDRRQRPDRRQERRGGRRITDDMGASAGPTPPSGLTELAAVRSTVARAAVKDDGNQFIH